MQITAVFYAGKTERKKFIKKDEDLHNIFYFYLIKVLYYHSVYIIIVYRGMKEHCREL